MSELSFEQMLEDSVKTIRNGEIVQGTVIDVKDDEIILNIGFKGYALLVSIQLLSQYLFHFFEYHKYTSVNKRIFAFAFN